MISSFELSTDNLEELESLEEEFSNYVRDTLDSMIDDKSLTEEDLIARLEITDSSMREIMQKDSWPFRTSVRLALAIGMEVTLGCVADK